MSFLATVIFSFLVLGALPISLLPDIDVPQIIRLGITKFSPVLVMIKSSMKIFYSKKVTTQVNFY
jgi:hypothetical protein